MFNQNANAQMMSNQQVQANNASTFGAENNWLLQPENPFLQSRNNQNSNSIFKQLISGQGQPAQNQTSLFNSAPPTPTTNNNNLNQPTSLLRNS